MAGAAGAGAGAWACARNDVAPSAMAASIARRNAPDSKRRRLGDAVPFPTLRRVTEVFMAGPPRCCMRTMRDAFLIRVVTIAKRRPEVERRALEEFRCRSWYGRPS